MRLSFGFRLGGRRSPLRAWVSLPLGGRRRRPQAGVTFRL